ncbi:UDP-3-O-(3-hydroxymyristoyl)glucosamine N-acyltransferase [Candidatus Sumerlaeota bacterium]|nr:UDP-3-O-(3-hydroxymyristoyl)glucosamine N-acyltransferase [Candidatus Sumerlaeota bacterium]
MTTQPLPISALCQKLGVPAPVGGADVPLRGLATLDRASDQDVSFVMKDKHVAGAMATKAALILAPEKLAIDHPRVVRLRDLMGGVLTVIEHFHPESASTGVLHPTAVISTDAKLGANVQVDAQAVIESGAIIGDNCIIGAGSFIGADTRIGSSTVLAPRVTILHQCQIGSRVRIHSGVVIGADGFRYEVARGRLTKIPQVGNVVIGDDVEIGANTTIDRAFLNETRVGNRTKIDNLVHVGHNVTIGTDCLVVAQVGIAGSVKIGNGVILAGQVGIADHIEIGDRSRVGGKSGITSDVPPGSDIIGNPAIAPRDYARFTHFYRNISSYMKRMRALNNTESRDDE